MDYLSAFKRNIYRVFAGFSEGAIQVGVGLLRSVYIRIFRHGPRHYTSFILLYRSTTHEKSKGAIVTEASGGKKKTKKGKEEHKKKKKKELIIYF